ncbi:MAG: Rieske 2Fe-2S domain-containing protein [Sphingobacteriaceae bacterium]|nr:Rieske 2Fe-2S domain-containing protein [Sphingobacteriaceae bacterium]
MHRRSFIKKTCAFCFTAGALGTTTQISGCAVSGAKLLKIDAENKVIRVAKTEFDGHKMRVIRSKDWDFDIALVKKGEQYTAMSLMCTHIEEPLMLAGDIFICNMHGSRFSNEGEVLQGPAQKSLEKLKTEVETDYIIIKLS